MDINTLKLFVRVYELENFSKAAAILGMTQPSISRVISDLENQCGAALFHRTGRGVAATKLGDMLFPRAQAMIMEQEQLLADVHSRRGRLVGEVSVGISSVLPRHLIVQLYTRLREETPGIHLRFRDGFSDQVDKWISEGTVDIGLPLRFRRPKRSVEEVVYTSDLVLIAPPDAPALPDDIPFDDLAYFPLMLPSPPNGTRMMIADTARRRGVDLNIALEVDSLEAQFDLISGAGLYSVLGETAVSTGFMDRKFQTCPIVRPRMRRSAVIKTTRQRPLSLAAREVIKQIRAIAKAWNGQAA